MFKSDSVGREVLQPYEIRIKELDSFVLRTREALNKCKKNTIKLARMRDIKLEVCSTLSSKEFYFVADKIAKIGRIFCFKSQRKRSSGQKRTTRFSQIAQYGNCRRAGIHGLEHYLCFILFQYPKHCVEWTFRVVRSKKAKD